MHGSNEGRLGREEGEDGREEVLFVSFSDWSLYNSTCCLSVSGMGHSSALSYREIVHIIICLSRANDYVAQSVRNGKSITEQRDIHLVVIVLSGHDMEMKL